MSVTDYKRKNKRAYLLIGMLFALLPALIAIVPMCITMSEYREQNQKLRQELSEKKQVTGYVFAKDMKEGEYIAEESLKKVTIRSEKKGYIHPMEKENLIGKRVKCNFTKGMAVNQQCLYAGEDYSADTRIKEFDFIEINTLIQDGDYIDIRIVYPNGEDYIVAEHKQLLSVSIQEPAEDPVRRNALTRLRVSEEEILRLASAYVDTMTYSGCKVYAISYLDHFQESAEVNYPVNPHVFQLLGWDENAIGYQPSGEEQQKRSALERNLSGFLD